VCGNGRVETGEACDDGNRTNGDGCSASCQRESDASLPLLINAGVTLVDGNGNTWESDAAFASDGLLVTRVEPISRTTQDVLYHDVRVGPSTTEHLRYEIPVSGIGPYGVRLHFAEIGGAVTSAGQRVFGVDVEGAFTIPDLDVFALVGRSAAYVRRFQVLVDDGFLTIELVPSVGRPMISAIEVFEPTGTPSNPPPKQPGLHPRDAE
jgi:cysteine-rich repeat protein